MSEARIQSDAPTVTSSGVVVALPTAAARPVRQQRPRYALKAGLASGKVAPCPAEYVWPMERAHQAREEARSELFTAGGVTRSAPFMLITALAATLSNGQRCDMVMQLDALAERFPGEDGPNAAAQWARAALLGRPSK